MEKYRLAYDVSRIEQCGKVFEKMSDICDRLSGRSPDNVYAVMLKEMSLLLNEFIGKYSEEVETYDNEIEKIIKKLETKGILTGDYKVIIRGDGRREIWLELKAGGRKSLTTREVANFISDEFNSYFISMDNNRIMLNGNFNSYTFVEGSRFQIVSGVAKCKKSGNYVSGDSYLINETDNGKVILGIADGMGSGQCAKDNSKAVMEMLEEAVKAGFSVSTSIEMINMAFAQNDDHEIPVTVDVCVVDTFSGVGNFVKLGAVATYIIRENSIELIQSETLPIGVLNRVDFDYTIKKLFTNNYIVMISDGALEDLPSLKKEEMFLDIISGIESKNPQAIASTILDRISAKCGYNAENGPKDDITVIVAGLFERT